jgi:DNA replicative helicase MCM subunit Mcm2 (Cdc46/Mcm family)
MDEEGAFCRDYQEIKVQEKIQTVGMGSIPRSIGVLLMDDLVDTVQPGDDVFVIGTSRRLIVVMSFPFDSAASLTGAFRRSSPQAP